MITAAIPATAAALIRPADSQALHALQRLAAQRRATIRRGTLTLAGAPRPAWLAIDPRGELLAAVLFAEDHTHPEPEHESES